MVEYSDEEYLDILEEIDALGMGLDRQSVDFIEDMLDRRPEVLTDGQRKWIIKLKERCLDWR